MLDLRSSSLQHIVIQALLKLDEQEADDEDLAAAVEAPTFD